MPPLDYTGPSRRKKTVRKKKAAPSPAFGALQRADKPIVSAQKQAAKKTEKATRKVVRKATVPYVPKLKDATDAQRGAARQIVATGLRKQGITTKREVDALPAVQRKRVNRAKGYERTASRHVTEELKRAGVTDPVEKVKAGKPHKRLKLPGATIDVTAAQRLASARLKGNPAAAVGKVALDAAKIAAADAAEIAVTTPSSVAKLASTAATDPGKVPGMLADPYKELAKDPVKFFSERPVSTFLMVQPAVRVPGRTAGRVARLTGKQTLKRPDATLPGTGLREQRVGSRDIVVRAKQSRDDKKSPPPVMSDKQVAKRADEFYDYGKKHRERVKQHAAKDAKKAGLTGVQLEEYMSGAAGGAAKQVARRAAEEFGSNWAVKNGAVHKPKGPAKGVLHKSRADAELVAGKVPFDAVVRDVGKRYAVMPKVAAERLHKHEKVGTSPAVGAKVMRAGRRAFTNTVLPTSMKWIAGQGTEAALRSAVAGAGPMSYRRTKRIVAEMERQSPGSSKVLLARATGGGQFGLTGTAREFLNGKTSLADEFAGTSLARPARAVSKAAGKPGPVHVRKGWNRYTSFVFDQVNSRIEQTAQGAMLGKAIKRSPLMERHVLGRSDKAIKEAAEGLRATETQVALGRDINRMYGQYQKFSPERRELLAHTTPFLPWYLNAATFLTRVLPVDHPVQAALLADVGAATEEWRKAAGLSLRGGETRPPFLLGGYPTGPDGRGTLRLGQFSPFGAAPDTIRGGVLGTVGGFALPQFGPVLDADLGVEWTGKGLKHKDGTPFTARERDTYTAVKQAEALIPGLSVAGRLTGVIPKHVEKKKVKPLERRLLNEVPFVPVQGAEPKEKKKAAKPKVRSKKSSSSGGGFWGGSSSAPSGSSTSSGFWE